MTYQELLARLVEWRCKPSVVARVLKLNPNGAVPGTRLRGFHRPETIWAIDAVGPKQFIAKHGAAAYRATDRRWWTQTRFRKAMRRSDFLDNVWKHEFTGRAA